MRRPGGDPGGHQVVAADLEPHAAQVGPIQRSTGSAGACSARARASASGGSRRSSRASSEGRCSRSRSSSASRGATRAAREHGVALAGGQAQVRQPEVELLGGARSRAQPARPARGRRRSSTAPSAAEATSSGSAASSGWSARSMPSACSRSTAERTPRLRPAGPSARRAPAARRRCRARRRRRPRGPGRSVSGSMREPEPRLVAQRAQQARGVVEEAARRAAPAALRPSRSPRPPWGSCRWPRSSPDQPDGHRVHREVAPPQVLRQRRRLHLGQRARLRVASRGASWPGRTSSSPARTVAVPKRSCSRDLAAEPLGQRAGARSARRPLRRGRGPPPPAPRRRSRTAPPTR